MKTLTSIFILIFTLSLKGQWIQLPNITDLNLNSVFFLNDKTGWICCNSGVVLRTTAGGLSWNQFYTNNSVDLMSIHFYDSLRGVTVGTMSSIFVTSDGGIIWSEKNINPDIKYNAVKYIDSSKIIIVGNEGKILLSTNWGSTWETIILSGPSINPPLYNISFLNSQIGWIGSANIVLKTEDSGYSWVQIFAKNDARIAVLTDSIIWRTGWFYTSYWEPVQWIEMSTDGGMNWNYQYSRIGFEYPRSIYIYNKDIVFVLAPNRIIRTTDGGINWEDQYSFHPTAFNDFCFIDSSTGWIVGNSGCIFKTTNGGGIFTGVEKQDNLTENFFLYQNYPNPFNSITKIKYTIPIASFVSIKVYDLLGKEVTTLVNEEKNKGNFEVEFIANDLSSGIYFYKILASDFSNIKKFMLLK